jgi:hypothetical protein
MSSCAWLLDFLQRVPVGLRRPIDDPANLRPERVFGDTTFSNGIYLITNSVALLFLTFLSLSLPFYPHSAQHISFGVLQ